MRRYDSYKDSGVEWIGEIPEGWEVKKIKHRCYVKGRVGWNGLKSSEFLTRGYSYLITGTDFKNDAIDWENCYHIDQARYEEDPFIQLQNEDLLITKDGTIGKLAVVTELDKPACLNSGIFVVRSLNPDFSTRYLFWVLKSNSFTKFNDYTSYGSTIQHLYQNVFVDFSFSFPSISEQTAIASFLDRKTAEIDQLIANKEKLIALYEEEKTAIINRAVTRGLVPTVKTRPSGVDWLGDIPEQWEVKRLKRLCSIISKGTTPSTVGREILPFGDIRFIKAENVLNNTVVAEPTNFIDKKTNEMICRSQLEESDILFVIAGATIGKVAILPLELCPANTNQAVSFIRLKNKETVLFVWYWLQSDFIKKVLWLDAVQSAQPNLSMENLGNFHVPFPSLPEQADIVAHIETECARLDTIIDKFKKQIELFKEYRTTLISEVVTGKIDVRGEVEV